MILIKPIDAKDQRYATYGDYLEHEKGMSIRVTKMKDWRHTFLLALHEFAEAAACKYLGIPFSAVDNWDLDYEKNRKPGDDSEPGEHEKCPYREAHYMALKIEMLAAVEFGIDWIFYEDALNKTV